MELFDFFLPIGLLQILVIEILCGLLPVVLLGRLFPIRLLCRLLHNVEVILGCFMSYTSLYWVD